MYRCMYRWIYVDMCMDSFETFVKIDEKSFQMGGKISPKSRKSVPGGTPKGRRKAKMIKRGGPSNSVASWERFFRTMDSNRNPLGSPGPPKSIQNPQKISQSCFGEESWALSWKNKTKQIQPNQANHTRPSKPTKQSQTKTKPTPNHPLLWMRKVR